MTTSYFEISGHIVQCDTESMFGPIPSEVTTSNDPGIVMGGRSSGFIERPSRTDRKPTVEEYGSVPGRVRRARLAFGIAGTMAMADGPLPVGDAVGIAVLIGYGSYEIYKSSEILSRAIFS